MEKPADRLTPAQVEETKTRCDSLRSPGEMVDLLDRACASVENTDDECLSFDALRGEFAVRAQVASDVYALIAELRATQAERDAALAQALCDCGAPLAVSCSHNCERDE